MLGMDVGDVAVAAYITLLSGAGGFLLWARLNRIEAELAGKSSTRELQAVRGELQAVRGELKADIEGIRRDLAGKSDKSDIENLRQELAGKSTTGELQVIRADLETLRREMAIMRSDLTQVALVVGARRSEDSEG